jgi:4-aminobutyrate aminotransferase-like enzyme
MIVEQQSKIILGSLKAMLETYSKDKNAPGTYTCVECVVGKFATYTNFGNCTSCPAGTYSNVIRFLPPLVITDELLKDALSVLEEGLASL